jgi:hypothetical protein
VAEGVAGRSLHQAGPAAGFGYRALDYGHVQVVTTELPGNQIHIGASGGKDVLPPKLGRRLWILSRQRASNIRSTATAPQISGVKHSHFLHLLCSAATAVLCSATPAAESERESLVKHRSSFDESVEGSRALQPSIHGNNSRYTVESAF